MCNLKAILSPFILAALAAGCSGGDDDFVDPRGAASFKTPVGYAAKVPDLFVEPLSTGWALASIDTRIEEWIAWRITPDGGSFDEAFLRTRAFSCLIEIVDDSCFPSFLNPGKVTPGETFNQDLNNPRIRVCLYGLGDGVNPGSAPPHTVHDGKYGIFLDPALPALMRELDRCIGIGPAPGDHLAHW